MAVNALSYYSEQRFPRAEWFGSRPTRYQEVYVPYIFGAIGFWLLGLVVLVLHMPALKLTPDEEPGIRPAQRPR